MGRYFLAGFCLTMLMAPSLRAQLVLDVQNDDPADVGFNDPGPPDGGDAVAQTLGEQRWVTVTAAARAWQESLNDLSSPSGAELPSLTLRISARFSPDAALPCGNADEGTSTVAARGVSGFRTLQGESYPVALWELLAAARGETPTEPPSTPAIALEFNGALGDPSLCPGTVAWDYSLPTSSGELEQSTAAPHLYTATLHELAHALGLTSSVDLHTGSFPQSTPDRFSSNVVLLSEADSEQALSNVTDDVRAAALVAPRRAVWSGVNARRRAAEQLARGLPQIVVAGSEDTASPPFAIGEDVAEVLPAFSYEPVTGKLLLVGSDTLCRGEELPIAGSIALVDANGCGVADKLRLARIQGVGALVVEGVSLPVRPVTVQLASSNELPALIVGSDGFDQLVAAAQRGATATLFRDQRRLVGADSKGRPYLYTPTTLNPGTTLTHFDPLVRNADPASQPLLSAELATVSPAQIDSGLALAMLADMGWTAPLCGNGKVDRGETCDAALENSDVAPNACRIHCQVASCGDAVTDSGEECDDGFLNSDMYSDACRNDCHLPHCGDGVVDFLRGEGCDEGSGNSDVDADHCRTDCTAAHCGDGVVDASEECDDGPSLEEGPSPGPIAPNASASPPEVSGNTRLPDRCRPGCIAPRCGDGIVDPDHGEECDDGNTLAGSTCSANCLFPPGFRPDDGGTSAPPPDAGSGPGDADGGVLESPPSVGDAGCDAPCREAATSDASNSQAPEEPNCDCGMVGTRTRINDATWMLLPLLLAAGRRRHNQVANAARGTAVTRPS